MGEIRKQTTIKSCKQKANAVPPCDSIIDYNESHLFMAHHIAPCHIAHFLCKRGVVIKIKWIWNEIRERQKWENKTNFVFCSSSVNRTILFVSWCCRGRETLQAFAHSDPFVSCSYGRCCNGDAWSLQWELWNGLWYKLWLTAWVNVQHAAL